MAKKSSKKSTSVDRSGGVDIHADTVNIYGDVAGRDKTGAGGSGSGQPPTPPPPPSGGQITPPQSGDQFEYDVFISYSSKDKDWVRGDLLRALEARGLRAIIDSRDFRPGAPSIKEIERAVLTSRKTLLILTPDYLASQWTEFENLLLQTLEPSNQNLRLIPLLKAKCELPLRLRMLTYLNFVDPDDWNIAWRQLLTALGAQLIEAAPAKETPATWHLAHPYGMPPNFTGRADERTMLTQWLNEDASHALLVIRALGGFGKSALTWHWLTHDVDPKQWPRVVWWSFYEGDASFENFVRETLEYLAGERATHLQGGSHVGASHVASLGPRQQVDALLQALRQPGTLLILDGFERQLRAFSGMNAAYQGDEAPLPRPDLGEGGGKGVGEGDRDCLSPIAEHFLRGVASLPNLRGKVLMTTRLRPRILEVHGSLLQGCREEKLEQMQPADAVTFFRAQGVRGSRAEIENACAPYGYHPLSLRLLAGLIVGDLQQPGDIAVARRLDVSGDLVQRQHHVLEQAYDSLTPARQKLLSRIACFRGAVSYEALQAFSVIPRPQAEESLPASLEIPRRSAARNDTPASVTLDADLHDLLARGLLHRDDKTNRFDLHPIVRRYAYDRLTINDRSAAHAQLRDYFAAVPKPDKVQTLDDLMPVIELYHHTVGAGQFDEARELYEDRLSDPIYFQLGAYQLEIELLRALFPDGEDRPPRLKDEAWQGWTLNALATSYSLSGQPRYAVRVGELAVDVADKLGNKTNVATGLGNVAVRQIVIGALKAAEANLRRRIDLRREIEDEFNEAIGYQELGRLLAYRGAWEESASELATALSLFEKHNAVQSQGIVWAYRALRRLLIVRSRSPVLQEGESSLRSASGGLRTEPGGEALSAAHRALELADEWQRQVGRPNARDYVSAHWLLGAAQRLNRNLAEAEHHLSEALTRCRNINVVELEAAILLDLARLRADQDARDEALRLAEEALLITERSEYVLQGADVHLFLAQMALQAGDRAEALRHALEARRLATCDGPPDYTYKVAYDEAGALLRELGHS